MGRVHTGTMSGPGSHPVPRVGSSWEVMVHRWTRGPEPVLPRRQSDPKRSGACSSRQRQGRLSWPGDESCCFPDKIPTKLEKGGWVPGPWLHLGLGVLSENRSPFPLWGAAVTWNCP